MGKKKSYFWGSYSQLRWFVAKTGVEGTWRRNKNNGYQFNAVKGGALMWWPSTKTITFSHGWKAEDKADICSVLKFRT